MFRNAKRVGVAAALVSCGSTFGTIVLPGTWQMPTAGYEQIYEASDGLLPSQYDGSNPLKQPWTNSGYNASSTTASIVNDDLTGEPSLLLNHNTSNSGPFYQQTTGAGTGTNQSKITLDIRFRLLDNVTLDNQLLVIFRRPSTPAQGAPNNTQTFSFRARNTTGANLGNTWHDMRLHLDAAASTGQTFLDGSSTAIAGSSSISIAAGTFAPGSVNLNHVVFGDGSAAAITGRVHIAHFAWTNQQLASVVMPAISWNTTNGDWTEATNWNPNTVPNVAGANVVFGNAVSGTHAVSITAPQTAGLVTFDSADKYTIGGTSTLTINSPSTTAITLTTGSHDITAPLALAKDTSITVPGVLTLTASNLQDTTVRITKAGTGTLKVNRISAGSMTISASGGTVSVTAGRSTAKTSVLTSLALSGGAAPTVAFDINDNDLILNYPSTSPLATTKSQLTTAYASGAWTGKGITSSVAAAIAADGSNIHKTALGYAEASAIGASGPSIDATTVLVRYTYSGDANLDGTVNALDFNALATNFGGSNPEWMSGDFNYDGSVTGADFAALALNFNLTLPSAGPVLGSLVPEPSLLSVALCAIGSYAMRRRRGNLV